ncbi:Zonadhesin, partial [Smittium mucronatum]
MKLFKNSKKHEHEFRKSTTSSGASHMIEHLTRPSLKSIKDEFTHSHLGEFSRESDDSGEYRSKIGQRIYSRSGSVGSIASANTKTELHSFLSKRPAPQDILNEYTCKFSIEEELSGVLMVSADSIYFNSTDDGGATHFDLSFHDAVCMERSDFPLEYNSIIVSTHDSNFFFFDFSDFELAYSHIHALYSKHKSFHIPNPTHMFKHKKKGRGFSDSWGSYRSGKHDHLKSVKSMFTPVNTLLHSNSSFFSTHGSFNNSHGLLKFSSERRESVSDKDEFASEKASFVSGKDKLVSEKGVFVTEEGDYISEKASFVSEKVDFVSEKAGFESEKCGFLSEKVEVVSDKGHLLLEKSDVISKKDDIVSEKRDIIYEKSNVLNEEDEITFEKTDIAIEKSDFVSEKGEVLYEESDVVCEKSEIVYEKS